MAIFNFIFGLTTWLTGIWVKRKGSFMERFVQRRVFWTLGAAMIFTSSYFFELIAGV
jgi:hypothetical protein